MHARHVAAAHRWRGPTCCLGLHHTGRHMDEASAILAELRELDVDDAARAAILYISAWDAIANARTELVAGMVGRDAQAAWSASPISV